MAVDNSAKPYSGPMLMPAGQYAGRPGIELRRPVYLIGSRSDARIHLQSSTVSRAHALIVQTRHETYIRDLASRTHVFVNGKRVREAVLRHNDLVAIGKFTFQYEGDRKQRGEEPPVPPAALQIAGDELPVPIDERVILIGRRPGSDITLTEEAASSTHAVIFQWEGTRFIRDLGSRTGTLVNGEPIHEVQLNPNDAIRIGETDITYAPSLEEAAFDLISDASDSLIARTPVAEEINLSPHEEAAAEPLEIAVPVAKAQASVEPVRAAEPIQPVEELAPIEEFAPLSLADEAAEEPVAPSLAATSVTPPQEEVPVRQSVPESIPLEPPVPLEAAPKQDVSDLVHLAVEEAEHVPAVPLTPHDTAHIPLAVAGVDKSADSAANLIADETVQPPPASAEIVDEALPLSIDEQTPAENLSDAIQPIETPIETSVEPDDLPTAITDASVSPDVHGLELLEDADLPRRGWRSNVPEAVAETDAKTQATPPTFAETESVAPIAIEPETNQPQTSDEATPDLSALLSQDDMVEPIDLATDEAPVDEVAGDSTIEPAAENEATIDLSALLPQDDVVEPIDFATDELPVDEVAGAATIEPSAEDDAAIDLSALVRQDDLAEPIDLAMDETPADEAITDAPIDLRIDADAIAPPFDEQAVAPVDSVDLSTIDFSEPAKTIADLATSASAAPIEGFGDVVGDEVENEPVAESPVGEPPAEIVPDEFVPTGEVIEEDFPADTNESLSSFRKRRSQSRTRAALVRRRKLPTNETIEPTEPPPQSALNLPLPEMPADLPPPPMPLIDASALSDTTFGRAVAEFEGDGAGPLVEDQSAHRASISIPPSEDASVNQVELSEPAESHAADAPLFDVPKIPTDLHDAALPSAEHPMENGAIDLQSEADSSPTHDSTPASSELDLSRLATTDASATPVDDSAAMDFLSDESTPDASIDSAADTSPDTSTDTSADASPDTTAVEAPAHEGHAVTDASSDIHPPVMDSTVIDSPAMDLSVMESSAAPPVELAAEPHLADVEIEGANVEGFEADEEHFLGGEPLSLRDGVHPPAGFGVVSVDFTEPPAIHDEVVHAEADQIEPVHPEHIESPLIDESHATALVDSALPESHDILPPESGDAIVPPQPPTLTSLSAPPDSHLPPEPLQSSMESPAAFADPFTASSVGMQVEIPPFDASATTSQELRIESDAPLRPKGKGRKSRVIRNGFGQNPDLPKAGRSEASPFADSGTSLAGMAMDGLAAPPVRNADVFSEMPARSESPADAPANPSSTAPEMPRSHMRDVGREMTNNEWMKTTPLPGRSRRRPGRITAVTPSITAPDDSDDAQDSEDSSHASAPAVGLTGMAPEYIAPRPAILLDDESVANAAAQRHRRLVRRVPILCATMIALVGVAITICALFLPVTQQIQATMSYRNFDSLTHEEQLKFEAVQNQKLNNETLRRQAITKLQNRHPNLLPGFLNDPVRFASLKLEWPETRAGEPGIAWVNYFDSTDKANDPARVQAVAQAMFDANSDMASSAQSIKLSMDQLAGNIKDETRQLDELKHKIEQERAFLDGRPTLAELNKLKSDDTTLETTYNEAMAKAKGAQAEVDQLKKQYATDNAPAAPGTDPVAADAQIKQMSKDADALNTKIAAARKERADLATKARATLDSAYDEFKKQVEGSQTITKDNPQLAAYVTAAQNLQQAIHQLTDEFIQKEQDEYKQLNDLKSNIQAKIQQRQADLFVNDPQLKDLTDKKEITTRKYNEAINSGLDKEASDEKNELSLLDNSLSARKEIISNDPVYTDLLTGLQQVIDQKQHSIDDQRKKTDGQLASMKTAFDKSTPSVEQLPAEQKQLANSMQEKLSQIDAARKQYAEAADASAGDADASVQAMAKDLQSLQTNIETRKRQVAAANSATAKQAREDQFKTELAQKTALLDQLNKQLASAQTAYQANHANLINRQSTADQSASAAQRLEEAVNQQQQIQAQHDQHQMAWDQKENEFNRAIEPLEPEAQAHLVGAPTDNRAIYAGVSSAAIVVAFLIAICWTVIGAARESHHAYTPSFESLDTPAKPKRDRNTPMNGAEPEENQAAVA